MAAAHRRIWRRLPLQSRRHLPCVAGVLAFHMRGQLLEGAVAARAHAVADALLDLAQASADGLARARGVVGCLLGLLAPGALHVELAGQALCLVVVGLAGEPLTVPVGAIPAFAIAATAPHEVVVEREGHAATRTAAVEDGESFGEGESGHQNGTSPSTQCSHPAARASTGTIAAHLLHTPTSGEKCAQAAQGVATGRLLMISICCCSVVSRLCCRAGVRTFKFMTYDLRVLVGFQHHDGCWNGEGIGELQRVVDMARRGSGGTLRPPGAGLRPGQAAVLQAHPLAESAQAAVIRHAQACRLAGLVVPVVADAGHHIAHRLDVLGQDRCVAGVGAVAREELGRWPLVAAVRAGANLYRDQGMALRTLPHRRLALGLLSRPARRTTPPTKPHSSPSTEKMKSVWFSGRNESCVC